jgi:type VI protein secretion system component VasK
MSIIQPFLAQNILPDTLPSASHWMGLTLKELLILLSAVTGVTLVLVIWAAYFRKRVKSGSHHHHDHHHHHSRSPSENSDVPEDEASDVNGEKRYRRKRRRRREHRPRNPTLAETGGLPPLRSERPSDPSP